MESAGLDPTVAIINSTPDVIEMLRDLFYRAGFTVVSCYTHEIRDGNVDFEAFIRQHRPRVLVYDIAPPYERNIRLFQHVKQMTAVQRAKFVLTSVHPENVTALLGNDDQIFEIVDREEDLMALAQAVKQASRSRETR